jgi:hypothetical protein
VVFAADQTLKQMETELTELTASLEALGRQAVEVIFVQVKGDAQCAAA